jgi:hypothetical protein
MKKIQAIDADSDALPGKQRRRKARRAAAIAVCVLMVVAACGITWWMALASCLPEDVTMTSLTTDQGNPTVARRLFEVGAYARDNKLFDSQGRNILFFGEPGGWGGANPGLGLLRERKQRIEKLRADHTVIEVKHRPREQDYLAQ